MHKVLACRHLAARCTPTADATLICRSRCYVAYSIFIDVSFYRLLTQFASLPYGVLFITADIGASRNALLRICRGFMIFRLLWNAERRPHTGLILAQCHRHWANITPALCKCLLRARGVIQSDIVCDQAIIISSFIFYYFSLKFVLLVTLFALSFSPWHCRCEFYVGTKRNYH